MRSTLIAALAFTTAVHCVSLKQGKNPYLIDHPGWQYVRVAKIQDVEAHVTFLGRINSLQECRELAEKNKLDVFGYQGGVFNPDPNVGIKRKCWGQLKSDCQNKKCYDSLPPLKPSQQRNPPPYDDFVLFYVKVVQNLGNVWGYEGCFRDTNQRALPHFLGEYISFQECKDRAFSRNFFSIGLQDGRQCWGAEPKRGYERHGYSNRCRNDWGGPWANQVWTRVAWTPRGRIQWEDDINNPRGLLMLHFVGYQNSAQDCINYAKRIEYNAVVWNFRNQDCLIRRWGMPGDQILAAVEGSENYLWQFQ